MMTERNKKEISTSTLLRRLFKAPDLDTFIEKNAGEMQVRPFHEYISTLSKTMEMVPEQVIKHAGIERSYGHQLFNGTRKPSRDKVIQLAFGFKLNLEETQKLLQIAYKSALYPKIKRDAAIIFCINNQDDILEMQSILQTLDLTLLGEEEKHA